MLAEFRGLNWSVTVSESDTVTTVTVNSAVAVLADRTAYDVQYTGRLPNRFHFQLQVHDRLITQRVRVEFMNAPKLILKPSSATIERDRPKFSSSQTQWVPKRNTTSERLSGCLKITLSRSRCLGFFFRRVLWLVDTCITIAKISEGTNRDTLVQILVLYIDPESHNAQRYRRTDRRTTRWYP